MNYSDLEELFWFQLKAFNLDRQVTREFVFLPDRKYRFDFAHIAAHVAVEVQGGIWKPGGHSTGAGISRDCEKYCFAVSNGWRVLPVTAEMVTNGTALIYFRRTIDWVSEWEKEFYEGNVQKPERVPPGETDHHRDAEPTA